MSLLAPWFLLGLAAIALPIWLHRLQTRNPKRQPFASAMLLEENERRLHVQKSLRYLALLALRVALLALLALAFAKPLWQRPIGPAARVAAQLHLIVVDTSASMGAGDRFARATAEARRIIAGLPAGDRAILVSAGDDIQIVAAGTGGPTSDKIALERALAGLRPGAGRLDDGALMAALDTLAGPGREPVQAHFVSDFQDSALPVRFGDLLPHSARAGGIELRLHPIDAGVTANWSVESIRRRGDGIDVGVRGRHTEARTLGVQLTVNDTDRGRQNVRVPADGQAVAHFDRVALGAGDNRVTAAIDAGDALAADDAYHAAVPNQRSEPVPVLTDTPDAPALKYLAAAFAAGGRYQVQATPMRSFDARLLERYRWLMIDDLGSVTPALAAKLVEFLNDGGAVFAAVGARAAGLRQLPLVEMPLTLRAAAAGDALTVGQIASHPLLANLRGWEALSIARRVDVQPAGADRVLIAASDGAPLLLEHPVGRGRLLLFASDLNNDWNDLPVQPVFVSFIAETADYLAGRELLTRSQVVGANLPVGGGGGQVIDPAGKNVLSLADTGRAQSVKLNQRGFYQVYTREQEALVAVNGDARESDLAPMSAAALARWRAAAAAAPHTAASPAQSGTPPPFELWRVLLPLLALIVVAESLLANLYLRPGARSV